MHVILAIAVFAVFLALYMVLFRIKSIEARKAKTSEELENLLPAIYTFSDEVNALKSSYISGSALDSITAKYADS